MEDKSMWSCPGDGLNQLIRLIDGFHDEVVGFFDFQHELVSRGEVGGEDNNFHDDFW